MNYLISIRRIIALLICVCVTFPLVYKAIAEESTVREEQKALRHCGRGNSAARSPSE